MKQLSLPSSPWLLLLATALSIDASNGFSTQIPFIHQSRGTLINNHHQATPTRNPIRNGVRAIGSLASESSIELEQKDSQDDTVEVVTVMGTKITLIGTAHLSKASNAQVKGIILSERPDVVVVELDPPRLPRIGYESIEAIGLPTLTAAELYTLPSSDEPNEEWWDLPKTVAKNLLLDAFSAVARKMLSGMYDDMSSSIEDSAGPGGEFVAAIEASKEVGTVRRIILGDRESVQTIRRAAQLVLDDPSTSPGEALEKLQTANQEEIGVLGERLAKERPDLTGQLSAWSEALIEEVKADKQFRKRLFARLEKDVPQFTQAFLHERDEVMMECMYSQALDPEVKSIVAVVGLAHIPGIRDNLLKKQ